MRLSSFLPPLIVALVVLSHPLEVLAQVCRECDDATRPCASCTVDVTYVTEPLPVEANATTVEENLFLGSFVLKSVRPETLASWQVTWSFPDGQSLYNGVTDAVLINPGGPGGQPARVVNRLDATVDKAEQQFSFVGHAEDGQDVLGATRIRVNGVLCSQANAENIQVSFTDASCLVREWRFCCGSKIMPPSPSPPFPPPAPPLESLAPPVVVQRGALSSAAQSSTSWLRNGSTMSALVVACIISLVLTIEVCRRVRLFIAGEEAPLADLDLEDVFAPKRKNTLLLPGQCFKARSDDLEGIVVQDDDTARMNAGVLHRHDLFNASFATYVKNAGDVIEETSTGEDVVEIQVSSIKLGRLLGRGAHGAVYAGKWNKRTVAVKKLHAMSSVPQNDLKTFVREVQVLSKIAHPKIVRMFGACLKQPHLCIVEEMMDGGSLHTLLHEDKRLTDLDDIARIAMDVALAMSYLHSEHIVHRDLKSHNVLLNSHGAKVADFGIARALEQTIGQTLGTKTNASGAIGGTPAYMAPECFHGDVKAVTTKCDVYSYSVLLWEMLSRRVPWEEYANHMQIIFAVAIQSQRLPLDVLGEDDVVTRTLVDKVIVPAWQTDPDARPDFHEVVDVLRKLLNDRVEARDAVMKEC